MSVRQVYPEFRSGFAHIILIVALAITLIIFGAVYFKSLQKTPYSNQNSTQTPTSVATQSALKKGDETTNWNTYINSKFNYSFKYPTSLLIVSGVEYLPGNEALRDLKTTSTIVVNNGENTIFTLSVLSQNSTLESYINQLNKDTANVSVKRITIAGKEGVSYYHNSQYYISIINNNYNYNFAILDNKQSNQILSTLQFLN